MRWKRVPASLHTIASARPPGDKNHKNQCPICLCDVRFDGCFQLRRRRFSDTTPCWLTCGALEGVSSNTSVSPVAIRFLRTSDREANGCGCDELILAACQGMETGQGVIPRACLRLVVNRGVPRRSAKVGCKERTMRVFTRPKPPQLPHQTEILAPAGSVT